MRRTILHLITFAVLTCLSVSENASFAGNKPKNISPAVEPHRIIFQLSSGDTLAHKSLMKQLNNIIVSAPDSKIEIVCHGPGLDILTVAKSIVSDKIKALNEKGVEFNACEFSMKERNIDKSAVIQEAGFVKAGIIEIITKQEQGWSYIKSGF
ncbi:MAG: DsrE family protein [Sphingobacteriales bacterium]|jgi:intracellular sulfur oxidation DsrE/DsrF family protein|nr:DsrE family protein [Sphingobacteriales bacterium]